MRRIENTEQPTSKAEHRSLRYSMFSVRRSVFDVFPLILRIPPLDTPIFTGILSRSVGNGVFHVTGVS
jgi:hypothetical protein